MKNEIKEMLKALDVSVTEDNNLRFVATKQVRDRDNDLIYVGKNEKGDGLLTDNFLKNPVFLAGHDQYSDPIGKVLAIQNTTGADGIPQTEILVQFADTDEGRKKLYLFKNGFLNAVSIRFRPKVYVFNDAEKGYDVFTSELVEVSAVSIPANQEALIIKGMKDAEELEIMKKTYQSKEITSRLGDVAKLFGRAKGDPELQQCRKIWDDIFQIDKENLKKKEG